MDVGLCGRVSQPPVRQNQQSTLGQPFDDFADRRVVGLVVEVSLDECGQGPEFARPGITSSEDAIGDFLDAIRR